MNAIAKFHNGEFDLVLLDVMMPKIDGMADGCAVGERLMWNKQWICWIEKYRRREYA